jgi:hypothetical protein
MSSPAANSIDMTTRTFGVDEPFFGRMSPEDLGSSTESVAEFALQLQRALATLYMIGGALLVFFLQHGLLKRHHAHLWSRVRWVASPRL